MDRLFISSQDDLQCVKADPEDGWGTDGSYTPDSERANNTDASYMHAVAHRPAC